MSGSRLCGALVVVLAATFARASAGQTLIEHSAESRFQLDLLVPDVAVVGLLPEGWSLNVASQGPAKDANLRIIFVDRLSINRADGKPAGPTGSNRLVYLAVPVKEPGGANVQLMIGGITEDPVDAPGPFGVYLPATTHTMRRATSSGSGPIIETQDWVFEAASGEHLEMHVTFERGVGNKGNPADVKFYSAKTPNVFQVSRQEQVLDILRNTTTAPPDRVRAFSLRASGGSYSKMFDGSEKVLSWDNILWVTRSVLSP